MRERCPSARLLGAAELRDFKLAFTIYSAKRKCGCADIVGDAGSSLWGLLYELSEYDLHELDRQEGCPDNYRRRMVTVLHNSVPVDVQTYEVACKKRVSPPSKEYMGLIRASAEKYSFPREYQNLLAEQRTKD